MKTKKDVCVKLTKKNCKKVLGILEMFGEPIYQSMKEALSNTAMYTNTEIIFDRGEWIGSQGYNRNHVKPRELRNILAKEHLEEGDVVVYEVGHRWLARVDRIEGDRIYLSKTMCLSDNWVYEDGFEPLSALNFLRYATDEEKALLGPVKEPEFATPFPTRTVRTLRKIEIAEFIGIPVEQLEIID